ncbi:uncharacterized protein LOC144508212 isoform X2 [Mustelus asterias]
MSPVLSYLLLSSAVVVVTVGVKPGTDDCPEVNCEEAQPVLLNCSDAGYARATLVQWWRSHPLGEREGVLLLQVLSGSIRKSPGQADMGLSRESCLENGDCSLIVQPGGQRAGIYHCVVWTRDRITERNIRLACEESSSHTPLIVGVILAVIGVACLTATAIVIYRRPTLSQHRQPGSYVNVPPRVHHSNQNSPESQSDYMSLNLDRQSLYSQLHK